MINIEKVRAISSFYASNTDNLYVTKLMKLFYYTDFISFAERGCSITNDTYFKLPYGPVPSFIKSEIDNLTDSMVVEGYSSQLQGSVKLVRKTSSNITGFMVVNESEKSDLGCLSEYEKKLLDRIVKAFKTKTAKQLTDQTHREKPYLLTSDNSQISYELAHTLDISSIV